MLQGTFEPTSGTIQMPDDVVVGYVPQVIDTLDSFSGGERLNKAITQALSLDPNLLLLDEPTNHLDQSNRKGLMKMLHAYPGTLIIASHDTELLRTCIDTFWHIDHHQVHVFSGQYEDYMHEVRTKRKSIEQELSRLDRQKKEMHQVLMQEQTRIAKSKAKGEKKVVNRRWMKTQGDLKAMQAEKAQGSKLKAIEDKKLDLSEQLANLRLPKTLVPKFSLSAAEIGDRMLITISEGAVGYPEQAWLLKNIHLSLSSKERIAIKGANGSGKSTLFRAILGDPQVAKTGSWQMPHAKDMGYLDQHYRNLIPQKSVFETIVALVPTWSDAEIRQHLHNFLFYKTAVTNAPVYQLSGGEKARLSLAQIAAKTPKLLILDEITNNIDLETKEQVIQVLLAYPGAMLVISHDEDFLQAMGISEFYMIEDTQLTRSL